MLHFIGEIVHEQFIENNFDDFFRSGGQKIIKLFADPQVLESEHPRPKNYMRHESIIIESLGMCTN